MIIKHDSNAIATERPQTCKKTKKKICWMRVKAIRMVLGAHAPSRILDPT